MPLPAMDRVLNILPPHLGDPTVAGVGSPYEVSMLEVAGAFGATAERKAILTGLLDLRALLRSEGALGFQLLAGSFVEDIEKSEGRPPNDVDVATIYQSTVLGFEQSLRAKHPFFGDQAALKARFRSDHYFVDLALHPRITFEFLRYWLGLFTHRRGDATYRYGVWKGILRVELSADDSDDQQCRQLLRGGPTP